MARYKYKNKYSWDSTLAYVVGLLASDGCLSGDGRHIDFTSKDWQLVATYRYLTKPHVKIGTKRSRDGSEYFRVQFGDVAFYDFLISAGLTPRKSKTIQAISVPDAFYADFLRGYFDGDGSISGYWDPRWKNSLMFYASYTSASNAFLTWMRHQNTRLASSGPGTIRTGKGALTLAYAKADSRLLFQFMYRGGFVPKLLRKYEKFVDLLEADPYSRQSVVQTYTREWRNLVAAQP